MEALWQQQHAYLVAAFQILIVSYIIYQRHFSPLAAVPGPFLASRTSLWLAHAYWRQDFHKYSIQLHKKYGPMVRVAPGAVDVGDVAAIKVIYGAGSKFWKGQWYTHLLASRSGKNLLSITDRAEHKQLRRMVEPFYTLKQLRENEELFDEPITFLAEQMHARSGQTVDMAEWMVALAVDAFTSMTYGKRYGMLEQGHARQMLAFTEENWRSYTPAIMLSPLCGWLAKQVQYYGVALKVVLSGGKPPLPIFGWVAQQIEEGLKAYKGPSEVPTLLEKTLKLHHDNPEQFDRLAIDSHMFEIVFAGFETCGATLPKMMYHIATTEGCQARLRKELEAAKQPSGLDGLATYDELCQISYLAACINEGFRIDPITGIALSRRVPDGGVTMNGFDLPAGTEIGITPWVISYNEEIMPEPEKFRPERWLHASKGDRQLMERMDLFFGAGPSGCIGKVVAMGFLYKVIAVIFSNFHVEAVGPSGDIREINIFPVKWRNVKMKLTPVEV